MECMVCHKPLISRGNRLFWIRNNHASRTVLVCGRRACQERIRDQIQDGEVYSYTSVNPVDDAAPAEIN